MATLRFLAIILPCQAVGEILAAQVALPVPGSVIGMALLLGWLAWWGGPPAEVEEIILGLLRHMSLLFVPAGVGVIVHLALLGQSALAVVVAVIVSTLLTIVVTGLVMQTLGKRAARTRNAALAAGRVPTRRMQPDRLRR